MKTTTRAQVFPLASATALFAISVSVLITGSVGASESPIYKTIAEDGSTVFTDQPVPDATIIKPAPLNVMDAPVAQTATTAAPGTNLPAAQADASVAADAEVEEPPATTIDSVVFTYPVHEQTFIDPEEQIWVEFTTSPADTLPTGMSANVRLDDELVVTGTNYRMPVETPERGTHTLQIELIDQTGKIMTESEMIQIHVRQHVAGGAN